MLLNLLAETAENSTNKNGWVMWVIIAVVLVLMIVLTIVPQKKRQKEQQKMMNSLAVGTKLMTVGGLVGRITQVNTDNTLIINVGTESNPTLIVIDRKAVGYILENVNAPAPAADSTATTSETAAEETVKDESAEQSFSEESATEETSEISEEEPAAEDEKSGVEELDDPFKKFSRKRK